MSRIRVSLAVVIAVGYAAVLPASAAEPDALQQNAFDAAMTEADRRFVAGDLQGALDVLEPACARSERAECSFSLGAIHHGLGHCNEALAYYRHYRAVAPQGEHSAEVTAALEEVDSRCGASFASADSATPKVSATSAPPLPSAPASDTASGHVSADPALAAPAPASTNTALVVGALTLSGAAAASSALFGILAARSARHCDRVRAYDRAYVEECEVDGPRYQGLWQGFAIASGGFLGIGLTLWWLDVGSSASLGVSGAGYPELIYRREF
jgi:hypothetical protein